MGEGPPTVESEQYIAARPDVTQKKAIASSGDLTENINTSSDAGKKQMDELKPSDGGRCDRRSISADRTSMLS